MNIKFCSKNILLLIMLTPLIGIADVCQGDGHPLTAGTTYNGDVTCGAGNYGGLTVNGELDLTQTVITDNIVVNGMVNANNANMQNVEVSGDFYSDHSTINGNLTSTGSVSLKNGSIVNGNVTSASGQVTVDSTSKVNGKIITPP